MYTGQMEVHHQASVKCMHTIIVQEMQQFSCSLLPPNAFLHSAGVSGREKLTTYRRTELKMGKLRAGRTEGSKKERNGKSKIIGKEETGNLWKRK